MLQGPYSVFAIGRTRTNFGVLHLLSAASLSRELGESERNHRGEPFGNFWEGEILAKATAAVLMAVAGLEAYANELFVDHSTTFPELPVEVMAKLWELYEQKPPLEKYEFAVLLKSAPPLDRGLPLYQNVAALIKLRNGLTHYKPEWSDELVDHAKISSALSGRIVASEFFPGEALFPRSWANHSCTKWAVQSVATFIDLFERQTKVKPIMAQFQERLWAL
jgi:hypothetical protein